MSDRGILLLFSLGVIFAALGVAVWLISTGQAAYIDGLFLLLCCIVLVLTFGLYAKYLVRSVMRAAAQPTLAKTAVKAQEKHGLPARVPAMQSAGAPGENEKGMVRTL
jgi:Ca2+/Na+ antiporter